MSDKPSGPDLTKLAAEILQREGPQLPNGCGLCVLVFTFGDEPGHIAYASNGPRDEMMGLLRDLVTAAEGN